MAFSSSVWGRLHPQGRIVAKFRFFDLLESRKSGQRSSRPPGIADPKEVCRGESRNRKKQRRCLKRSAAGISDSSYCPATPPASSRWPLAGRQLGGRSSSAIRGTLAQRMQVREQLADPEIESVRLLR